ncbi:cysteine peptidase family C39 domain-containing protein [Polyangium jinanense]|uniref:Peptidase C39 domain-containing protein n=1 Tax=Polyangium jinanense TaxID=2829994 RepID=A0A9X3X065_9BACT|nr:cysteine peptidase family C39 domain-containing protein [Polyangium jinanense]MDC3953084.1 hypothetical protein [Polyangium jinanense]MDC3979803.1 hypothetical protein [Polyangium jinanense]
MVRQELPMSCGAACVRQILLEAQIDVPEATIRDIAGYHPEMPMLLDGLADALTVLHPGATYRHGGVRPEDLDALAGKAPFIALLRMPSRHFVIVDEVGSTDVRLRDPAGTEAEPSVGAVVVMKRATFLERWTRAYNGVLWRVG